MIVSFNASQRRLALILDILHVTQTFSNNQRDRIQTHADPQGLTNDPYAYNALALRVQDGRSNGMSARRFWTTYGPGTEPIFKKRYPDSSAVCGTVFCSRNTIRFETSTVARSVAGANSGLLDYSRAEHPTTHCLCLAKTESSSCYSTNTAAELCALAFIVLQQQY